MGQIKVELRGSVALARLNRGVTNALNRACVEELAEVIQQVRSDPDVRALVVASSNDKFFSIGFNIPELFELSKDRFGGFYRAFNRACLDLYTLPKPTIAAITGHAIAGGCILALCCDYRFIAEGRKLMGLNEVKLGVPVPYVADRVLHALAGARQARRVMESGEFYGPEESLEMGMVDQVWPLEQVVDKAMERAEALGSLPGTAYGMIKRNRVEAVEQEVGARREEKEGAFIECWYSDEARERLREAMEKF